MGNSSSRTKGERSADIATPGVAIPMPWHGSTQHRAGAAYNHDLGMEVTEHLYEEQRVLYDQVRADQAKAAEQARQQRELQASRERERLAEQARQQRELQASRTGVLVPDWGQPDWSELQEQARETRAEEAARLERRLETRRLEAPVARAGPVHANLPQVCRRHNTRQGCNNASCRRLHVCRLYMANICKHGVTCRYGHSLTTVHNQVICDRYDLDTAQEQTVLEKLRRDFEESEELPPELYVRNIERCFKHGSRNPCWQGNCNRLHICRQYVAGTCSRARCKFGHDLRNTHNAEVLSRHWASDMSNEEILQLLRGKDNKTTDKADGGAAYGASTSPSAPPLATEVGAKGGGGADKLAVSAGVGASAGLSEELTCPVCLDMFNRATTLGCGHTFCAECLQETRNRSGNTCPLCRAAISSAIRSVTLDNIIRNVLANQ